MSSCDNTNPCIACGACCCGFRVSFYWAEADDAPGGQVPVALTEALSPWLRAMRGTNPPQRCIALSGEPGHQVGCTIYPLRSSTCREFAAWQEDGQPNPVCTRARAKIGLPELAPIAANASALERRSAERL